MPRDTGLGYTLSVFLLIPVHDARVSLILVKREGMGLCFLWLTTMPTSPSVAVCLIRITGCWLYHLSFMGVIWETYPI